jgi:hypothetical protein
MQIKYSSNPVYDSKLTRIMAFKLLHAVLEGAKEYGDDALFFEPGDKSKIQVGSFEATDVRGDKEQIELYLQPKSARPDSSAYMATKRENNGKMAVVLLLQDDLTFGEFIKKVEEEKYFEDIFTSLGHEITHVRESESKQKAYSQEEDKRLENLRNTNRKEYNKEYPNSAVEFEALMSSIFSYAEAELLTEVSFKLNKKQVMQYLENIRSGKLKISLVKYFMNMLKGFGDKVGWDVRKKQKAYSKINSAADQISRSLEEHIVQHVIKNK